MDTLSQKLFQLMLQLSRIQNSSRILESFIERMNSIFKGIHFSKIEIDVIPPNEVIEIKTAYNEFGKLSLEYGQLILPISQKNLINNAVDMLAILLENRKQQEKLAY
ncbi:MAG: hypothetical protein HC830_05380, partial [Bacteroidetes bacterium]|nr:hypothetical protein [Bacteroidota bacterium]